MINADATMGRIGGECDDRDEDGTNKDGIVDNSDATILAILLDHDATNAPADDNGKEDNKPKEGGARKGWRGRGGRRKRAGIDVGVGRGGGGEQGRGGVNRRRRPISAPTNALLLVALDMRTAASSRRVRIIAMATEIGKTMPMTTTAGRGTRALLLPHVLLNIHRRRMLTNVANSAWTSPGGRGSRRVKSDVDDDIAMVQWHDDVLNAVVDINVGEDKDNGGGNAMGVALPRDGRRRIEYWNGGTAG
jgi:hypothetical protein